MPLLDDISGQRFGMLVARQRVGIMNRVSAWLCDCDCGDVALVKLSLLRSGDTKSCGCLKRLTNAHRSRTHGHSGSPTYISWAAMMARCTRPSHRQYPDWGGRGIRVCERWRDFSNFLADMGERPQGRTLDRIDNDGNYEPGNCRWATPREQVLNRRRRVPRRSLMKACHGLTVVEV